MNETQIIILVVALFVVPWLIYLLLIAKGSRFKSQFNSIRVGMSQADVIKIVGEPNEKSETSGVMTCKWNKVVQRWWHKIPEKISHTVVFKDGVVVTVV